MKLKPVSLALFALGLATGPAAIDHARADQFAVDSGKICVWTWNQTNAYRQSQWGPKADHGTYNRFGRQRVRGISGAQ
jgi:hypothetical protein